MSSERTAVRYVRVVNPQNLRAKPVAVLLAICCCLSAAGGQWLEKEIALSDSFGNIWPTSVYFVPIGNCVYVADYEDGDVVVVDAATNARTARIELAEPTFMAFDSQDNKVYVAGRDSVAVIDPVSHRVLHQLDVGSYPTRIFYNPTANKLYCIAGERHDSVTVVDCGADLVIARIWVGRTAYDFACFGCDPAGNKVYVASYAEDDVKVIDGAGDSLLTTIFVGDRPVAPTYSPVSNKIYCASYGGEEVVVIDAGPDTLLRSIDLDQHPLALGYNPVSNKMYCGDAAGYVHVVDCGADTILASLDLDTGDPVFFVFDSVDNQVFCFPDYGESVPVISGTRDTIVGSVGVSVDVYYPEPACYSPQQNRLYIRGRSSADVAVVDAASCEPVAAIQMQPAPSRVCYVAARDKLYCSDAESGLIAVINCSTDSVERKVLTPGSNLCSPVYSSGSDKLYYGAWLGNDGALLVVDCAHDSFEAKLSMNFDATPAVVYNPVMDRIYWAGNLGESTVVVVDCAGDSVIAEVPVGRNPCGLACNPDSNRVYCASFRGDSMFVSAIDCAADSVTGTVFVSQGYYSGPELMCYVPSRDAVVCTTPDNNAVVVDGAAKQLVGYVQTGGAPRKLHLDRASNKLYCLLNDADDVAVIDCRDMTLQAKVRLAHWPTGLASDSIANRIWVTSPDYSCISLVDGRTHRFLDLLEAGESPGDITWAPQHRKMYVVDEGGQAILVLRDTSLAGVHESPVSSLVRVMPTIVHGVLYLPEASSPKPQTASLLDASGRKVAELQAGANDVRALAPGVYFVRTEPSAVSRRPSVVTKVVITR